jgi:DNA-binding FadR family transcriptional regulator
VVAGRRSPADLKRLWAAINEAEQQLDNPNRGVHLQQEFHSLIIGAIVQSGLNDVHRK